MDISPNTGALAVNVWGGSGVADATLMVIGQINNIRKMPLSDNWHAGIYLIVLKRSAINWRALALFDFSRLALIRLSSSMFLEERSF